MVIFLTALLASAKLLPQVDREALDLQARAEALQPRHHVAQPARRPAPAAAPARPTVTIARQPAPQPVKPAAQPVRQAAAPAIVRQPTIRRASAGTPLDLGQITTICRAAGEQEDPAAFIGRLSNAYALSADDRTSLRASCAAYLAGRADARRSGGAY
jgi:hypothetical protein